MLTVTTSLRRMDDH